MFWLIIVFLNCDLENEDPLSLLCSYDRQFRNLHTTLWLSWSKMRSKPYLASATWARSFKMWTFPAVFTAFQFVILRKETITDSTSYVPQRFPDRWCSLIFLKENQTIFLYRPTCALCLKVGGNIASQTLFFRSVCIHTTLYRQHLLAQLHTILLCWVHERHAWLIG